ncbi:hypothetical protein [Thiohalorhabdus sp.]|uniref:hypothetical protein n=1 Tax=Thiohalorhabdus sp. TaxID=3094134 RepID=UPI002FC32909
MFRRLRKAADVALGATVSGWQRFRHNADLYADTGRESRSRIRDRLERETEAWRETGREQLAPLDDRIREELERALRRAHLVTHSEQAEAGRQMRQLQARVANLEAHVATRGNEDRRGDGDR